MIQISDSLELNFFDADEKLKLTELINTKKFTVSNTPLTYRQINSLDSDNLLGDKRESKKGWRKFSIKELLYIQVVAELKKFGLKHEQLQGLWNAFYAEASKDSHTPQDFKRVSELAIGCSLLGVEITLTVDSEGNVGFYDPNFYALLVSNNIPHVRIVINDYINNILNLAGLKEVATKWSSFTEHNPLKANEKDLIQLIRDENYNEIRIKKKNGELEFAYRKRNKNLNGISSKDLWDIINTGDFQDIQLKKRDGKIVNLNIEESYKF